MTTPHDDLQARLLAEAIEYHRHQANGTPDQYGNRPVKPNIALESWHTNVADMLSARPAASRPVAYKYLDSLILAKHWTANTPPEGWTPLYTTPQPVTALSEGLREAAILVINDQGNELRITPRSDGKWEFDPDWIKVQFPAAGIAGVDEMVNRFLCWPLPKDFAPDAGISFNPGPTQHMPLCWPVGTNLFTAAQAKAMFLHCLATPAAPASGGVTDECGRPMTYWGGTPSINPADPLQETYSKTQAKLRAKATGAAYPPAGDGMVLVPVRLCADAVSAIKDWLADEYQLYDYRARPLWAGMLKIVAGLSIEQQEAINEQRVLAAANAPAPDDWRERDRERFSDPAFNRWLDEGISDAGHTTYDYIGGHESIPAAWSGWEARPYYAAPAAGQAAPEGAVGDGAEIREILFGALDRDRDNITTRNLVVVAVNALHWTRQRAEQAEAERDRAGESILAAIGAQFEEMAQAAYNDNEYDRRDVWRNAASQAFARARQPDWIKAALAENEHG